MLNFFVHSNWNVAAAAQAYLNYKLSSQSTCWSALGMLWFSECGTPFIWITVHLRCMLARSLRCKCRNIPGEKLTCRRRREEKKKCQPSQLPTMKTQQNIFELKLEYQKSAPMRTVERQTRYTDAQLYARSENYGPSLDWCAQSSAGYCHICFCLFVWRVCVSFGMLRWCLFISHAQKCAAKYLTTAFIISFSVEDYIFY